MQIIKNVLWFLAMLPLEVYGRLRGVYRVRFGELDGRVVNAPAGEDGPVVCFGDSLTAGYGVEASAAYPAILQGLLDKYGVQVINAGRSGDTAADGLARLEADVLSLKPAPRVVIVGFGGNDLMQRRPIEQTFSDLETMVCRIQAAGAVVILLGLRGSWLYKVDYEEPFYRLAKSTGAALVPLCLDGVWGYPWLMCDAAHPNARGYRELARRVEAVVLPLLAIEAETDQTPRAAGSQMNL